MNPPPLEPRLDAIAAASADPARTRLLCALMNGRAYTAAELSAFTKLAIATVDRHLAQLLEQQWVSDIQQGRHRYFRLASQPVVDALATQLGLAVAAPTESHCTTPRHLCLARTCYGHLAGEVAVALHDRLLTMGWLDDGYDALSAAGRRGLQTLELVAPAPGSRRRLASACLDWSERRPHLGGQLGAALLTALLQQAWLLRQPGSRALTITPLGRRQLHRQFGIAL